MNEKSGAAGGHGFKQSWDGSQHRLLSSFLLTAGAPAKYVC